jgi:hypothetical protein
MRETKQDKTRTKQLYSGTTSHSLHHDVLVARRTRPSTPYSVVRRTRSAVTYSLRLARYASLFLLPKALKAPCSASACPPVPFRTIAFNNRFSFSRDAFSDWSLETWDSSSSEILSALFSSLIVPLSFLYRGETFPPTKRKEGREVT